MLTVISLLALLDRTEGGAAVLASSPNPVMLGTGHPYLDKVQHLINQSPSPHPAPTKLTGYCLEDTHLESIAQGM